MRRVLALALTLAVAGAVAAAAQVGGATYTGTHGGARGGAAKLVLNSSGTRVIAYSFGEIAGDSCSFVARGDEGVWQGAEIDGSGAFSYRLYDSIVLEGRFNGRTATGTLRLRNRRPCDSGEIKWSVAAPGTDPPKVPGVPTPAPADPTPAPTATPKPGTTTTKRRTYLASFAFGRKGSRIVGRLRSGQRSCVAKRKLTLKRGKRVVARATATSGGSFTFRRTSKVRNRTLRIAATTVRKSSFTCGAVTSHSFRG